MEMNVFEMFEIYRKFAYTENYIIGGVVKNDVKFYFFTGDELINNLTLSKGSTTGSRGATTLRLKFSGDLKKTVENKGFYLCTKDEFENLAKTINGKQANRGLAFEKLIFEYFKQEWKQNNKKFTECGDIVINGIHCQIKTAKATFTNTATLRDLMKEGDN
jgi:hypothetical protein